MNDDALRGLLKTLIAESCLKIGCCLPSLVLNMPSSSLCRTLGVSLPRLPMALSGFGGLYSSGDCSFSSPEEGMVVIFLSGEAIRRAYEDAGDNPFLQALVTLAMKPCSAAEDYRRLFRRYGEPAFREFSGDDFDFLAFFPSGQPDRFIYCIKDEGGRCDYHRFTREDYVVPEDGHE